MSEEKSQADYLREDLHNIVRTRYGKMNVPETIGILETVKWELINDWPKAITNESE